MDIQNVELWLQAVDMRNLSSHTYKGVLAEQVYSFAENFLPEFQKLIKAIEKKMKFGLTAEEYNFVKNALSTLEKRGTRIYCHGSRGRGDHNPFSDLDLMTESPQDLSYELSAVREQLENSNFPYKVDLVQLSEFADSYKPEYEREKVLF